MIDTDRIAQLAAAGLADRLRYLLSDERLTIVELDRDEAALALGVLEGVAEYMARERAIRTGEELGRKASGTPK